MAPSLGVLGCNTTNHTHSNTNLHADDTLSAFQREISEAAEAVRFTAAHLKNGDDYEEVCVLAYITKLTYSIY